MVNGLLAHRTAGRWNNTQENAFILLALDRYFNTFEAQTPDFVARIWLGETYAGEHEYVGRTTERHETKIPMSYLVNGDIASGETQDLIIEKDGQGRLYYRPWSAICANRPEYAAGRHGLCRGTQLRSGG